MVNEVKRIDRYGKQIGGQRIVPTHVIGALVQMISEGLYVTYHHHGGYLAVFDSTEMYQERIGTESEGNGDGNTKYRAKQTFPEIVSAVILCWGFCDIVQDGVLGTIDSSIFLNL